MRILETNGGKRAGTKGGNFVVEEQHSGEWWTVFSIPMKRIGESTQEHGERLTQEYGTRWKDPGSEKPPEDTLLLGWWWKTRSPHVVYLLPAQAGTEGKGWFFFDNGGLSTESPPDLWAMIQEPQKTYEPQKT